MIQRVGGSNELLDQWLHARKELLVAYCTVSGIKPHHKEKYMPLNEKALEKFYHLLVDYLSAGHFRFYNKFIKQVEGVFSPKITVIIQVYSALEANTETIMAFHDRYTNIKIDQDTCVEFHQALSHIGEALNERFTLEDQLIQCAAESCRRLQTPDVDDPISAHSV